MFSSVPSATISTGLPEASLPSASSFTFHADGFE